MLALDAFACASAWLVVLLLGDTRVTRLPVAMMVSAASALLCVVAIAAQDGYHRTAPALRTLTHRRVLRACLSAGAAIFVVDALAGERLGAGRVLVATGAAAAAVLAGRAAHDEHLAARRRHGRLVERVLVVADEQAAARLFELVGDEAAAGWRLSGAIGPCAPAALRFGVPHLGSCTDAVEAATLTGATVVVAAASALRDECCHEQLQELRDRGVDVHVDPNLAGFDMRHLRMTALGHDPLLYLDQPRLRRCQQALKRAMDVTISSLVLVVAAPVLAVAMVAIKLEDGGPVLFRQRRVGRDGATFLMPKLRTMSVDAEQRLQELRHLNEREGALFKLTHDPRVTRVGRVLRATSVDELPQLVSVLRGQMSLIGPRPALPDEVRTFDRRLATRHRVRPGVTGLWQVEERDSTSFVAYRRLDLFYVENWSLLLDLTILLRTVPAVLGRGWRSLRGAADAPARTVTEVEPAPPELVAS